MGVIILVIVAILVGFLVIMLANRSSTPIAGEEAFYQERTPDASRLETLTPAHFERLCRGLLEEMGLVINSCTSDGTGQIDISALNPQPITGGEYIIHCYLAPKDQPVESIRIIALSDTVKAEGASKGIFITTGYFSEEVPKLFEGPPIELINGRRFGELLAAHHIPLA